MKKIISGKKYDTGTAAGLGSDSNGGDWGDYSHWEETLYRKRTGEFFLHGEGGPMSRYAETVGANEWSGGSRIMPMTWGEARKWAEEHLSADDYEEIFGEIEEDESKVAVSIRVSAATLEKAKRAAAQAGISLSAFFENAVSVGTAE